MSTCSRNATASKANDSAAPHLLVLVILTIYWPDLTAAIYSRTADFAHQFTQLLKVEM